MAKAVVIDGVTYRRRRGRLVAVPEEWLGKVPNRQTINKRPSKALHKRRKEIKHGDRRLPKPAERGFNGLDDGDSFDGAE